MHASLHRWWLLLPNVVTTFWCCEFVLETLVVLCGLPELCIFCLVYPAAVVPLDAFPAVTLEPVAHEFLGYGPASQPGRGGGAQPPPPLLPPSLRPLLLPQHVFVCTQAEEICAGWVQRYKGCRYPLWAHMLKCYAQMHSTHDAYEIQQVGLPSCVTPQAVSQLLACSCTCQKHAMA